MNPDQIARRSSLRGAPAMTAASYSRILGAKDTIQSDGSISIHSGKRFFRSEPKPQF